MTRSRLFLLAIGAAILSPTFAAAQKLEVVGGVEGQPLAANVTRLLTALEFLGSPLPKGDVAALQAAVKDKDAAKIQELLDPHVLVQVSLNPESRVKAARGPVAATLQQHGYTPVLLKIVNESTVKSALNVHCPQAGPVYSGAGLQKADPKADKSIVERFLQVELYTAQPMTSKLSGLKVEYAIVLISSSESGKR
jgi:hypothetical protein